MTRYPHNAMIDKKIESNIKALNEFLEFWGKFHSIYSLIISKELITKEDEEKFLETKVLIRNKYSELKGELEFKYMPHARLTDPVNDVLGLAGVRFMSEVNMKKLDEDWKFSYMFLNNILERLKNNKRRLGQFNPMGVYVKRFFERKGGSQG